MGIDAAALVKIPQATLVQQFGSASASTAATPKLKGLNDRSFRVMAVGTSSSVLWTDISFADEPDDIARALRELVGDTLDAHDDLRGIYVFPSKASPKEKTYDGIIDEFGELGFWVKRKPGPRPAKATTTQTAAAMPNLAGAMGGQQGDMMAQLQGIMSAIPPEILGQITQMMTTGDMSKIDQLGVQLEQAMANRGGVDALEHQVMGLVDQMGGIEALTKMSPDSLEGLDPEMLKNLDPSVFEKLDNPQELVQAMNDDLEKLRQTDPAKYQEFQAKYGEMIASMNKKTT